MAIRKVNGDGTHRAGSTGPDADLPGKGPSKALHKINSGDRSSNAGKVGRDASVAHKAGKDGNGRSIPDRYRGPAFGKRRKDGLYEATVDQLPKHPYFRPLKGVDQVAAATTWVIDFKRGVVVQYETRMPDGALIAWDRCAACIQSIRTCTCRSVLPPIYVTSDFATKSVLDRLKEGRIQDEQARSEAAKRTAKGKSIRKRAADDTDKRKTVIRKKK